MRTNLAYQYQDIYNGLKDIIGDNPILLQSFVYNNNADIIKAIQYYKEEKNMQSPEEQVNTQNLISRFENLMVQRLLITEDLFANSMPIGVGPAQSVEQKVEIENNETKVIEHPASVGKKKDKKKDDKKVTADKTASQFDIMYPTEKEKLDLINEKLIPKLQDVLNKKDKNYIEVARKTCNFFLKNFGEYIHYCSDVDVLRLINWIESGRFVSRSPISVLHDTPLSIADIVNEATNLILESGLGEEELKDAIRPYVLNVQLKEQKAAEEIISTEEGYSDFFRRTLSYLLDEDQQRRDAERLKKQKQRSSKETRENLKEGLYETHKEEKLCIFKMARDLNEWVREQGQKTSLNARVAEILTFVRTKDPEMYERYLATKSSKNNSNGGDKDEIETPVEEKPNTEETTVIPEEKPKVETSEEVNQEEESQEEIPAETPNEEKVEPTEQPTPDEEKIEPNQEPTPEKKKVEPSEEPAPIVEPAPEQEEANEPTEEPIPSEETKETLTPNETEKVQNKVVYPKFEEQLKYKVGNKAKLTEWLITLVNKHIGMIGTYTTMELKLEAIAHLAKKAFLDIGVKDCADWTEQDVAQYVAQDIIPFITDEYAILASRSDSELKTNLDIFLKNYPAGKEKERTKAIKAVLISEVPRTDHMKHVARKVRKDKMDEISKLFSEIALSDIVKQKEEVKV